MSIITRSTHVPHPDDRLARWYRLRYAYLNADEVGNYCWPELQHQSLDRNSKPGWPQRKQVTGQVSVS